MSREQAVAALRALDPDRDYPTGALHLYERFGFTPHRRWATIRKAM